MPTTETQQSYFTVVNEEHFLFQPMSVFRSDFTQLIERHKPTRLKPIYVLLSGPKNPKTGFLGDFLYQFSTIQNKIWRISSGNKNKSPEKFGLIGHEASPWQSETGQFFCLGGTHLGAHLAQQICMISVSNDVDLCPLVGMMYKISEFSTLVESEAKIPLFDHSDGGFEVTLVQVPGNT